MIINGNTFAYGAFQLDTRPLYITFTYDSATSKYVPDVEYTAQQIIEISKTRPVIAKVYVDGTSFATSIFAPITQTVIVGTTSRVVFGVISYSNPTDLSMHWFIKVVCENSTWEVTVDDQN